jgi:hypothetical protein
VLAPGFLGFDHFGGFPYFAQTVATAIRVSLEECAAIAPGELAIVASDTVPAGSLAQRQQAFFSQLQAIVNNLRVTSEDPELNPRIHIVGHSTGAVDAELFVSPKPLGRASWTDEEHRIRRSIRSIVGIAAPLSGTGLAESALGRLLAYDGSTIQNPVEWWKKHASAQGMRELAQVLLSMAEFGPADLTLGQLIAGSLDDFQPLAKFLGSLLSDRALLNDLRPAAMCDFGAAIVPDRDLAPAVHIARFLTVARTASKPTPTGRLFEMLHALTAKDQGVGFAHQLIDVLNEGIQCGRVPVIGSRPLQSPITLASNDGIVNTARQMPVRMASAGDPLREVAAVVVADHLDVLGGFPMAHSVTPGSETNDFLISGSEFRSPEFSQLYRAVAKEVRKAMGTNGATAEGS